MCATFKTQYHNYSPYIPKMNDAVEAASKKINQKIVVTLKDWHEMLSFALHGYDTSVRTSIGATLFSLVYVIKVVLPIEVEIHSLRVLMEEKLKGLEWVQTRLEQLNLIKG